MEIRRSGDREITRLDWLVSRASFSGVTSFDPRFGHPRNTHHGVLITHNEDTVDAGWGFDTHRHRNVEIVTWVLSGAVGVPPSYAQTDTTAALATGELVPVVSGLPRHRGSALGLRKLGTPGWPLRGCPLRVWWSCRTRRSCCGK